MPQLHGVVLVLMVFWMCATATWCSACVDGLKSHVVAWPKFTCVIDGLYDILFPDGSLRRLLIRSLLHTCNLIGSTNIPAKAAEIWLLYTNMSEGSGGETMCVQITFKIKVEINGFIFEIHNQ